MSGQRLFDTSWSVFTAWWPGKVAAFMKYARKGANNDPGKMIKNGGSKNRLKPGSGTASRNRRDSQHPGDLIATGHRCRVLSQTGWVKPGGEATTTRTFASLGPIGRVNPTKPAGKSGWGPQLALDLKVVSRTDRVWSIDVWNVNPVAGARSSRERYREP